MSSSSDDTILPPPRRPVNSGGLGGDTFLPSPNAPGIHVSGDVIDNRYTVIREIGRGGMGVVYEVEDAVTTRRYAIKRLLPDMASNDKVVQAFVREGTIAEQFSTSSPHFVTTKTVGKDSCGFYVLMELVNLPTLRQVLRAAGRLELNRAVAILNSLATGLADLHKANLIHRDLKPENIFVNESEHATTIKLVDFGLTRDVTTNSTIGMSGGGSLKYMAPEQFRDEPATMASDVYAFGVIAYEMLTGELPTYGESLTDYVPDSLNQLVKVISRCLAGKVERRIDNAITLTREIVDTKSLNTDDSGTTGNQHVSSQNRDKVTHKHNQNAQIHSIDHGRPIQASVDSPIHETKVSIESLMHKTSDPDYTRLIPKTGFIFKSAGLFPDLERYVRMMCRVPSGTFEMGCASGNDDEKNTHSVKLSSFRMGATPVTYAIWNEYLRAMGYTAITSDDNHDHPVANVSWIDIMGSESTDGFCAWASEVIGENLVLPTEAQFEYAALGGQLEQRFPWGNLFDNSKLWCSVHARRTKTATVNRTDSIYFNEFGLSDMCGNVSEWCRDYYAEYSPLSVTDPVGPSDSPYNSRCIRGGAWADSDRERFRCCSRDWNIPGYKSSMIGFRLLAEN